MSWYTKKAISSDPNEYEALVDVNVYGVENDLDVEASRVSIKFKIDIEARSWGIKNISAFVYGTVVVPLIISKMDNSVPVENREVIVDLSKIKIEENSRSGLVTLGGMDLYLDSHFNVDYSRSSLEILK